MNFDFKINLLLIIELFFQFLQPSLENYWTFFNILNFGVDPKFWLGLQDDFYLEAEKERFLAE